MKCQPTFVVPTLEVERRWTICVKKFSKLGHSFFNVKICVRDVNSINVNLSLKIEKNKSKLSIFPYRREKKNGTTVFSKETVESARSRWSLKNKSLMELIISSSMKKKNDRLLQVEWQQYQNRWNSSLKRMIGDDFTMDFGSTYRQNKFFQFIEKKIIGILVICFLLTMI